MARKRPEEYVIVNGKRYENCYTIMDKFYLLNTNEILMMRQQGLPHVKVGEFYYYNIDDFTAWHADKDLGKHQLGGKQ